MLPNPGEATGTSEPGTRKYADRAFGVVTGYIDDQPLESGLTLLSGYRNQFDALETKMLARNTKEASPKC